MRDSRLSRRFAPETGGFPAPVRFRKTARLATGQSIASSAFGSGFRKVASAPKIRPFCLDFVCCNAQHVCNQTIDFTRDFHNLSTVFQIENSVRARFWLSARGDLGTAGKVRSVALSAKNFAAQRLTETPSLSDQVRNILLESLTSGHLRPGGRINEAELALKNQQD